MKIAKILNNNIAIAVNDSGQDVVVMGCGVAFQKKHGDEVDQSKVERIFTNSVPEFGSRFEELLNNIPMEYLDAAEHIIEDAKLRLGKELADSLYLTLTDHIYFASQRCHDGMMIRNRLLMETKMLYKDEYLAGLDGVEYLNERFSLTLTEDEAAFLALHFVNASMGTEMNETMEITKIVQQVRSIIQNYFLVEFSEESLDYYRMMTHLKFFAQRMVTGKSFQTDDGDLQLFQMVRDRYEKSFKCMERVMKFLRKEYQYDVSSSEQLYLTIHIERIRKASGLSE